MKSNEARLLSGVVIALAGLAFAERSARAEVCYDTGLCYCDDGTTNWDGYCPQAQPPPPPPPPDPDFVPSSADRSCGYAAASWNAPAGAAVFNRGSDGPITPIMNAVGESRTHSMISLGQAAAIQSTFAEGSIKHQISCQQPIKPASIQYGWPGLEEVNPGALYSYYFGGGGQEYIRWQWGVPRDANNAAVQLWSLPASFPPAHRSTIKQYRRNDAPAWYSLFQYRDVETAHVVGGASQNNGWVCSTALAYAHAAAGLGVVEPHIYPHDQIMNAANSLHRTVYDQCKKKLGFWGSGLAAITCRLDDACNKAAHQVTNCMALNQCGNNNGSWRNLPASAVGRTISPDRLAGRSGHPRQTTWSWSPEEDLQWNSPGNVYGCWN